MKPIEHKEETAKIQAVIQDEEGHKIKKKLELRTHNVDTIRYVEKKLAEKGMHRLERHPVDGRGGIGKPPPKDGHGGKYTWEGPDDVAESLLNAPIVMDEKDPNYADDDVADEVEKEVVVGEVEVAKVVEGREGVARIEVDPNLVVKLD